MQLGGEEVVAELGVVVGHDTGVPVGRPGQPLQGEVLRRQTGHPDTRENTVTILYDDTAPGIHKTAYLGIHNQHFYHNARLPFPYDLCKLSLQKVPHAMILIVQFC